MVDPPHENKGANCRGTVEWVFRKRLPAKIIIEMVNPLSGSAADESVLPVLMVDLHNETLWEISDTDKLPPSTEENTLTPPECSIRFETIF